MTFTLESSFRIFFLFFFPSISFLHPPLSLPLKKRERKKRKRERENPKKFMFNESGLTQFLLIHSLIRSHFLHKFSFVTSLKTHLYQSLISSTDPFPEVCSFFISHTMFSLSFHPTKREKERKQEKERERERERKREREGEFRLPWVAPFHFSLPWREWKERERWVWLWCPYLIKFVLLSFFDSLNLFSCYSDDLSQISLSLSSSSLCFLCSNLCALSNCVSGMRWQRVREREREREKDCIKNCDPLSSCRVEHFLDKVFPTEIPSLILSLSFSHSFIISLYPFFFLPSLFFLSHCCSFHCITCILVLGIIFITRWTDFLTLYSLPFLPSIHIPALLCHFSCILWQNEIQ